MQILLWDYIVQTLLYGLYCRILSILSCISQQFYQTHYSIDFNMQILSYGFYLTDLIIQILLYGLHYADFIVQTLLCGLHHADSIMQLYIPMCGFHCKNFIIRFPSCQFYRVIYLCGFYFADVIKQMVSCGWYCTDSIVHSIIYSVMQVLLYKFHFANYILCFAGFFMPILLTAQSYGFHCTSIIAQILLFEFYYVFMPSIARIPLSTPLNRFYHTIVNFIMQI